PNVTATREQPASHHQHQHPPPPSLQIAPNSAPRPSLTSDRCHAASLPPPSRHRPSVSVQWRRRGTSRELTEGEQMADQRTQPAENGEFDAVVVGAGVA